MAGYIPNGAGWPASMERPTPPPIVPSRSTKYDVSVYASNGNLIKVYRDVVGYHRQHSGVLRATLQDGRWVEIPSQMAIVEEQ